MPGNTFSIIDVSFVFFPVFFLFSPSETPGILIGGCIPKSVARYDELDLFKSTEVTFVVK